MEDLVIKPSVVSGEPPVVIARLTGKLNEQTAPLFRRFAAEVAKRRIVRVVLDIPELRSMGSTGFDAAVKLAEGLAAAGGQCAVSRASPKIRVIFDTLGLNSVFQLFPNLETAVLSLRPAETLDANVRRSIAPTPARPLTSVPDSLPPFDAAVGHFRRALAGLPVRGA